MQIVILCGGLATRLGEISKNTPKSMIKIDGKPFLEYQIEELKKQNVTDIILCVGHLSEKIIKYFGNGEKFGVQIQYSHDGEKPLGPIGALKKAEPLIDKIFFTLYGDSYVFVNYKKIYENFQNQKELAGMIVYENFDKYDKSNIIIRDNKIIQYAGKKTWNMKYIDYGVSIFKKKTLEIIPKNKIFTTKNLYTKLVEQKQLLAYEIDKRFYHIGNPEALSEFTKYIQKQQISV